jgi:hypothetical protein
MIYKKWNNKSSSNWPIFIIWNESIFIIEEIFYWVITISNWCHLFCSIVNICIWFKLWGLEKIENDISEMEINYLNKFEKEKIKPKLNRNFWITILKWNSNLGIIKIFKKSKIWKSFDKTIWNNFWYWI